MRWNACLLAVLMVGPACAGNAAGEPEELAQSSAIEITATDFAFSLKPDEVPAGEVETTLTNEGDEPHQAGYYLLNEGVTYDEFVTSIQKDDSMIPQLATGGRSGHLRGVSPGETGVRPGDELERGNYAVLCSIRDPKTGQNHYELGMVASLTVK